MILVMVDGVYKQHAKGEVYKVSFKEITPQQAWEMMQQGAILVDIRDNMRFGLFTS